MRLRVLLVQVRLAQARYARIIYQMRVEPFGIGSYVHVFKRGARGMNIVRDDNDRWRFLKLLRYLNDENVPRNWEREITSVHISQGFTRPEHWPDPDPYVSAIGYCLMNNHFHLLLRERKEYGVSKFMQRLCSSMSNYHNAKYAEKGTLFQGSYKAKTVHTDRHLQYLFAYIHVKNPFELYPGGLTQAVRNFDEAFAWAERYPFSALPSFSLNRESALLDTPLLADLFEQGGRFKKFSLDVMLGRMETDDLADILFD